MRINPNQAAEPLAESSRASNQNPSSLSASTNSGTPLGEDQAQLSDTHVQVQALAAQALQLPEVRQEKVSALRQAIVNGAYSPDSGHVADALFTHMLEQSAA